MRQKSVSASPVIQQTTDHLAPAIAAREFGNYTVAIKWLDEWIATHKDDVEAMALLTNVLLLDKQGERAAAVLTQAQILAPNLPSVQRNQARIGLRNNQPSVALQASQNAMNNDPENPESWLIHAAALSANKRDAEALVLVDRAVKIRPAYAEAWASRALLLLRLNDKVGALGDIDKALGIKPHLAQLWALSASLLHEKNDLLGAIQSMKKALETEPLNVDYLTTLGEYLRQKYQGDAAISILEKAVALSPGHPVAWANLGAALHEAGHLSEARIAYDRALGLNPNQAEVYHNLGSMAKDVESWEAALPYFERALKFDPNNLLFLASMGQALLQLRHPPEEVERIIHQIFSIEPNHNLGMLLLGSLYRELGRFEDAARYFQMAVLKTPNSAEANVAVGMALVDIDKLDEAENYLRRAFDLNPNNVKALSNLLFTQNYLMHHSAECRLLEARHYGLIASSKVTKSNAHTRTMLPTRLRVGMVSGDLRNHPVGYFLESFLPQIDKTRIELIAYPTQPKYDELTERLRSNFRDWIPLFGKSDLVAAQQITNDGIHVLIDLSGHTTYNRLTLFAWKPAPLQVSWLGYFATTGVEQMDFLLGDPYVTPPHEEGQFTERIWRMPESYLCFSPPAVSIEVAPLPAFTSGYLTFGCFNNLTKMNDAVVLLWACVLKAVPRSRLLLKTKQLADQKQCQQTLERFATHGISAERLILEGPASRPELLATYHRVDIALDPFPYPGGTTSAEALWMGVPVLTKRGNSFLSHVGESIAHNAGLEDWIALDDADYISKAVMFANDLPALARLRDRLRAQVLVSPLFDAARFARHFDQAIRGMWQQLMEN